jgi:putative ABC transport system permease protein
VLARTIATLDLLLVPYGGLAAYGRSEQPSYRFLADELEEIKVETTVIPALFLGVAAFLLYVVLSRVVSMQRAEIGLLKAFGYSHLAVGLHFLWFAVATAALGVAIGLPGGLYLGHWFVGVYRTYFHFPRLDALVPPALPWLVGVIALAAAALGAIAAVRRAVSLPPAEAMRPEPPARFRAGVLERSGILARATPVARMMIRNLTRRPVKALLSVTTIALAIGLLVVGRFALDAVDALLKLQFNDIQREDVVAVFAEPRCGCRE